MICKKEFELTREYKEVLRRVRARYIALESLLLENSYYIDDPMRGLEKLQESLLWIEAGIHEANDRWERSLASFKRDATE